MEFATEVAPLGYLPYGVDGWEEVTGGRRTLTVNASLFWYSAAGGVDSMMFGNLGERKPITVIPARGKGMSASAVAGERCYLGTALSASHNLVPSTSAISMSKLVGKGSGYASRGKILNDPRVAVTADGNGSDVTMPAVTSGQTLVANLHVMSKSGTTPTITASIQSDDNGSFTTPFTVATFDVANDVDDQTIYVSGPNTDTHYRVVWDVGGTLPSFLALVSIGITKE